jgi:conjugative transfer pilus assembly protein TraH
MLKIKLANTFFSAALLTVTLIAAPGYAHAGLEGEMNKMFGSMSNATAPGAYKSSRRGVITGGGLQVRNKVMNTDLISLEAPSVNGGCGGLDFFGGSFSFIDKDRFVQLVRTVASNAAGFAFFIALRAMSNEIAGTLENIQKKIQQFNEFFGNSCQLAKGIVTDTKDAIQSGWENNANLGANLKASSGDLFESFTNSDGETSDENPDPETKDKLTGNLVWGALNEQRAQTWWTYGDDDMLEIIMSVSGTVIVELGSTDPSTGDQSGPKTTPFPGGAPSFIDLVKGGDIDILECNDSECMSPSLKGIEVKGFETRIREMLNGENGADGIIDKINANSRLSNSEERFLGALPTGLGGMIFRLARLDPLLTQRFASSASEALARNMAYQLISEMLKSAEVTLQTAKQNDYTQEAIDMVRRSRGRVTDEMLTMAEEGAKLSDSMARYNQILQAVGHDEVQPQTLAPGS